MRLSLGATAIQVGRAATAAASTGPRRRGSAITVPSPRGNLAQPELVQSAAFVSACSRLPGAVQSSADVAYDRRGIGMRCKALHMP